MTEHRKKICKDCGEEKSLRQFYRSKSYADGYMAKCKECRKKQSRENYDLKREVILEKKRIRRQTDPEYRERCYAVTRQWARTERGKKFLRESRRAWEVTHPEQWARIKRENDRKQKRKQRQRLRAQRQQQPIAAQALAA